MLIRFIVYISFYFLLIFIVYPNTVSYEPPLFIYKVKNSLSQIAKNQDAFFRENKRYTNDIRKLGVRLYPNYTFEIIVSQDGKAYKAKAASKPGWKPASFISDKKFKDVWLIDQDYNLEQLVNMLNDGDFVKPYDLFIFGGIPLIAFIDIFYCLIKRIEWNRQF